MHPVPPAATHGTLPTQTEVVIIGGGIVGCATAYFLSKQGVPVVLCEKGGIAEEQSGRNMGFVRQQGRDAAEIPAMRQSLKIWQGLESEIGSDIGWKQDGCLYLADNEDDLASYESWLDRARQYQLDSRLLSRSEVRNLLPSSADRWLGGLHTPSDGRAEPRKAAPALAQAAERLGAKVLSSCAVRSIDTEAGAVAGVYTERGLIRARVVVCAAGAWSSLFNRNHGIELPQLPMRTFVARTAPAPAMAVGTLWSPAGGVRRRQDGGYNIAHTAAYEFQVVPDLIRSFDLFWHQFRANRKSIKLRLGRTFMESLLTPSRWDPDTISPFERIRTLDPQPNQKALKHAIQSLQGAFSELRGISIVESWGGIFDVTPDARPIIGSIEQPSGYYIATGFSGHGFGLGPGVGQLVCDLIVKGRTDSDVEPFRLKRFTDKSGFQPATAI